MANSKKRRKIVPSTRTTSSSSKYYLMVNHVSHFKVQNFLQSDRYCDTFCTSKKYHFQTAQFIV